MSSMVYENPLFFKDLSPIEIEYHNENPFIEYENKKLSNPTIFKNLYGVTLREAKRVTVMEPEAVGMLFTYSSLLELDEDISGDAILYSSGNETISAGSSALYKYHFFLKKNKKVFRNLFGMLLMKKIIRVNMIMFLLPYHKIIWIKYVKKLII